MSDMQQNVPWRQMSPGLCKRLARSRADWLAHLRGQGVGVGDRQTLQSGNKGALKV